MSQTRELLPPSADCSGRTSGEISKWESLGEGDIGKKVKNLKKKLRQIEELEEKKAGGSELNAIRGQGEREANALAMAPCRPRAQPPCPRAPRGLRETCAARDAAPAPPRGPRPACRAARTPRRQIAAKGELLDEIKTLESLTIS